MPHSKIRVQERILFDYKSASCEYGNHEQVLQLNYPQAADNQESDWGPCWLLERPYECTNGLSFPSFLISSFGRCAGWSSVHKSNYILGRTWQELCNKSFLIQWLMKNRMKICIICCIQCRQHPPCSAEPLLQPALWFVLLYPMNLLVLHYCWWQISLKGRNT